MFSTQYNNALNKVEAVKKILQFRTALVEFIPKEKDWAGSKVTSLMQSMPDMQNLKVYDHSACFNSLYNIFETFVHTMISSIILDYERHYKYCDLPLVLIEKHSSGVGEILTKITQNRYSHINKDDLHRELYQSTISNGEGEYSITPETIYAHDNNIRMDILSDLFNRVEYSTIANFLGSCPSMKLIVELSEHATCQGILKEFVDRRNDCSHGEIDEILSINELLFYCDFVITICSSISEFSASILLSKRKERNLIIKRGRVTECFSNNASVSLINSGEYRVGGKIFIPIAEKFTVVTIESIQMDDEAKERVELSSEIEVGFKTNIKLKVGMEIYL